MSTPHLNTRSATFLEMYQVGNAALLDVVGQHR